MSKISTSKFKKNVMVSLSNHRGQSQRAILRQAQGDRPLARVLRPFAFYLSALTFIKNIMVSLSNHSGQGQRTALRQAQGGRPLARVLRPFAFYLSALTFIKNVMVSLSNHWGRGQRTALRQAQVDRPLARVLKPFAFYLLPFAFLTTACKFNPNTQTPGQAYLQGEWKQDSVTMQQQLVNYSLYNLKFNCDSFFVQINTFSKVNAGADSCMKSGRWAEYAKGVYEQKNDTLHVRGIFCNPDYSYKDPTGCLRSGVYEEYFKVKAKTDSIVELNPTSGVIPIDLKLIKRTTCNPKPL